MAESCPASGAASAAALRHRPCDGRACGRLAGRPAAARRAPRHRAAPAPCARGARPRDPWPGCSSDSSSCRPSLPGTSRCRRSSAASSHPRHRRGTGSRRSRCPGTVPCPAPPAACPARAPALRPATAHWPQHRHHRRGSRIRRRRTAPARHRRRRPRSRHGRCAGRTAATPRRRPHGPACH
ncbi:hypothetical protein D3C71_1463630 [compost metagenome]